MKEQNPNLKLLVVSVIYILITVFIWLQIKSDESASLGYFFTLIVFWAIAGIVTGIIIQKDKIKLKNWNLLIFFFCTPIPFIITFKINSKEQITGTYEYNRNGHHVREISYSNRKEYSTNVDSVFEENQVSISDNYHLDSIVFYNGNKTKYFK